jgi:hypothetical protein
VGEEGKAEESSFEKWNALKANGKRPAHLIVHTLHPQAVYLSILDVPAEREFGGQSEEVGAVEILDQDKREEGQLQEKLEKERSGKKRRAYPECVPLVVSHERFGGVV